MIAVWILAERQAVSRSSWLASGLAYARLSANRVVEEARCRGDYQAAYEYDRFRWLYRSIPSFYLHYQLKEYCNSGRRYSTRSLPLALS